MNTAPLQPAALSFTDDGVPFSAAYRDIYHPRAGALTQARHVFLAGNGLPGRWQGRDRFVVLETGFGLGNNFLATWQAWLNDPQRCERLVFISIEAQPLSRDELAAAHRASPLASLVAQLHEAWPPLTPDLHTLDFEAGRVRLMLGLGDVQAWLPELVASVDAFFLDGFAPDRNPRMWDARVCKALGRLAAPEATLATWTAATALRGHLRSAGFEVRLGQGTGGKRDITLARYAPAFTPRRAPARASVFATAQAPHDGHALIVGGGIAGCAAAWALAEQGWHSTLFERHADVAREASGNPAGLFHGIVNAHDGVHARFNRAAALQAGQAVRSAVATQGVKGAVDGLLRLETGLPVERMRALLQGLGLPPSYVDALDADQASARAGLQLHHPSWFYPAGGWVHPAGLARAWLARAAARVRLRTGCAVHALRRCAAGWQVLDAAGTVLAQAPAVVLANAGAALQLLDAPGWPLEPVRGQLSMLPSAALPLPRVPVAGAGYLLPEVDGHAVFGATTQRHDDDASVRDSDHRANVAQLALLVGQDLLLDNHALQGRTAWRWSVPDRLPLIGAVPDPGAAGARLDQPRLVPRQPGLFVFTALGSRGITWSALGARVLAAAVTGAPAPIAASLIDAVDPARFVSRAARRR